MGGRKHNSICFSDTPQWCAEQLSRMKQILHPLIASSSSHSRSPFSNNARLIHAFPLELYVTGRKAQVWKAQVRKYKGDLAFLFTNGRSFDEQSMLPVSRRVMRALLNFPPDRERTDVSSAIGGRSPLGSATDVQVVLSTALVIRMRGKSLWPVAACAACLSGPVHRPGQLASFLYIPLFLHRVVPAVIVLSTSSEKFLEVSTLDWHLLHRFSLLTDDSHSSRRVSCRKVMRTKVVGYCRRFVPHPSTLPNVVGAPLRCASCDGWAFDLSTAVHDDMFTVFYSIALVVVRWR